MLIQMISCIPRIFGCTDELAVNYNEINRNSLIDVIQMIINIEYILGCTDPTASNFDPECYW